MTKAQTKTIRITLSALTRVEYSEVLEIPAGLSDMEIDDLIDQRYDEVDGGLYQEDPQYWERGSCIFSSLDSDESTSPQYVVTPGDADTNGDFVLSTPTQP